MHLIRLCLVAIAVTSIGCEHSKPPAPNQDDARTVLQSALDSWVAGKSATALEDLIVAEPLWEKGVQLLGFDIKKVEVDGYQSRGFVQLNIRDAKGKSATEKAEYVIVTSPKRSVVRMSEGW